MHVCVCACLCMLLHVHACLNEGEFVHSVEDVPLLEFMYLVFTCMPGESYC